jgi:hypothetical protein
MSNPTNLNRSCEEMLAHTTRMWKKDLEKIEQLRGDVETLRKYILDLQKNERTGLLELD